VTFLFVATILAGALLGRIFKVWVLILVNPAILIGGLFTLSLLGYGFFLSLCLAFGLVTCLEIGFASVLLTPFIQREVNDTLKLNGARQARASMASVRRSPS